MHIDNQKILSFLLGEGINDDGKTIQDIWNYSNLKLSNNHTYIQWLFPLDQPSKYNPSAPYVHGGFLLLMEFDIPDRFDRNIYIVRQNMISSLDRMLAFYGFERDTTAYKIIPKRRIMNFRRPLWLRENNHNLLRLTRIQRSLYLFRINPWNGVFTEWLSDLCYRFPGETKEAKQYWFTEERLARYEQKNR